MSGGGDLREHARRELARRRLMDFVLYTHSRYRADPFHRFLAARLEEFERQVRAREAPRLMVFAPPQHGKSELVSRRFPAWVLGRNPEWRLILASYGAEWAEELSGDARGIVQSEDYADLFGAVELGRAAAVELDKTRKGVASWRVARHGGGMAAVGVGGPITGRPAEILIVDDPVKGRREADSEVYREETKKWWPQARDRVQDGGGIILMMTRWHHDDLAGHLLRLGMAEAEADQWEVLNFPAVALADDVLGRPVGEPLAPGRFSAAALRSLRAVVGHREWQAKFMGVPTDEEGMVFRREWWRFENLVRARPQVLYQFWDLAFSRRREADWSVCTTWGVEPGPTYRLLDVYRVRQTMAELKRSARRVYEEWGGKYKGVPVRAVIVERKGREDEVYRGFRQETRLPVLWYVPDRDKLGRAHAITPFVEAGQVILPEYAPWKEVFLDEMGKFPAGEHDDQVDSFTMGLICMALRAPGRRVPLAVDFRVVAG